MLQMDLYTRRRQWVGPRQDSPAGYQQVIGIATPETPIQIEPPNTYGHMHVLDRSAAWLFKPHSKDPNKSISHNELNVMSLEVDDTFASRLGGFLNFYGSQAIGGWRKTVTQRDFMKSMGINPTEHIGLEASSVVAAESASPRTLAIGEYAVVSYANKITRFSHLHLLLGLDQASADCLHILTSRGYLGVEAMATAIERHTATALDHPTLYTQPTVSFSEL